jgi:peptidoglycan/xylan/chitin deacetylase (PgdA/CDA1 family)
MNPLVRKYLRSLFYHSLKQATNLRALFPGSSMRVPILVYHRVCPLHFTKQIPYANVYPDEFEKQIDYLRTNYQVITLGEYFRRVGSNQLHGDEVCVTFDDGFRDNYLYAFPILKHYGVAASFFLVTKYIGSVDLFPWVCLDEGGKADFEANRGSWLSMSWDEVGEMAASGMEFGTHSHTHRTSLSQMTEEEAANEIRNCTELFKERTGQTPAFFCFPHGTRRDYNRAHVNLLKSMGYKGALTTNIGRNLHSQDPYELNRLIIYEEDSFGEFKKKVRGAYDFVSTLQKGWLRVAGAAKYQDFK